MYASGFSSDFADARGYGWDAADPSTVAHGWNALMAAKDAEVWTLGTLGFRNPRFRVG